MIIVKFFIPVETKRENENPISVTLNNDYLLYKCIKVGGYYVFKLCECNTKNIDDMYRTILVFSLNQYEVGEHLIIKKDILFKNSNLIVPTDTFIEGYNDYVGCASITEMLEVPEGLEFMFQ